jgi:hypothetical protein
MDNQTLKMEVFLESLTDAQAATCQSDEKQLAEIFSAGWSEATAVHFHRAMLHARGVSPEVTVEGVFETAFRLGLSFIGDEDVLARLNQAREDDVIVFGVQRKDGKSGSVHLDGGVVVKTKAKRLEWKKGQVRGV